MAETDTKTTKEDVIGSMFEVGAHFAYSKSRRHPTVSSYIFGAKDKVEIFDLEKTKDLLDNALEFIEKLSKEGKNILFVAGKNEARDIIKNTALSIDMPYVTGRWIGGTLTNFEQIKKRISRLEELTSEKEKGELAKKYTKKELVMLNREMESLENIFGGLISMKSLPAALVVIDTKREAIAVEEAKKKGIPVVALMNSDCDLASADYPILANDASMKSIAFFVEMILDTYKKNMLAKKIDDSSQGIVSADRSSSQGIVSADVKQRTIKSNKSD